MKYEWNTLKFCVRLVSQIRNVETNQCVDNMGRKENERVGFFNCHGMGGNQVRNLHTCTLKYSDTQYFKQ